MKRLFFLICITAVGMMTYATNYYLSPKGNDAKDGTSEKKALATLAKAQELAQPGDNVYILPGTYQISESPAAEDNQDINGYGHIIENNIAYGTNRSLQWVNGDVDSCTVNNNSFTWNKETKNWDNTMKLKSDMFDSVDPEVLLGARDREGMYTDEAMAFLRQKRYGGIGADFSGYKAAVAEARKHTGAEVE